MATILLRRGTAAQWTSANPTLQAGEPGFETDTGKLKIGNGSTAWNSLAYENTGGSITESQISLSDVTTDDATTARHGFLKKLTGVSGTYMNGMGQWAAIVGLTESEFTFADVTTGDSSSTKHGFLRKLSATSGQYLDGTGQWSIPPGSGLSGVSEANISLSDITTANVNNLRHGFAPKSPGDATKFLNGATNPDYAQVKDSDLSTSDITTNNVSSSKHGFAPKNPGDSSKFLNGAGGYTVPGGGGGGSGITSKLYSFTVSGADQASIDTNVDGSTVANFDGFDYLEILIIARTDEAVTRSNVSVIFNNDTAANYDLEEIRGLGTSAISAAAVAQNSIAIEVPGNLASANYAATMFGFIPSYNENTFYKSIVFTSGYNHATAGSNFVGTWAATWRNTSTITRIKLSATTGGAKLKIGSRLLIYGR